ncbi:citrate lyase subunit alpha [Escherichia coli]
MVLPVVTAIPRLPLRFPSSSRRWVRGGGFIPTLVDNVLTCITPGSSVDILVTDHGIAVNPARPELAERLQEAGIKVVSSGVAA